MKAMKNLAAADVAFTSVQPEIGDLVHLARTFVVRPGDRHLDHSVTQGPGGI